MSQDFSNVRKLIEMSQNLPDLSDFLRPFINRQMARQIQPVKPDYLKPDYLMMVLIKEIVDSSLFTFVWTGFILLARAIPNTSSLTAGETVLVRKMPATSEYIHVIRPSAGLLFAAPGIRFGVGVEGKADLYQRQTDGTWSLFLTITGDDPSTDELYISYGFWWSAKGLFYIIVSDHAANTKADIYSVDVETAIATKLNQTVSLNTAGTNWDRNSVVGACFFGADAYLVGTVYDPILGTVGVVFKFDGTTLTRVDDDGGGWGSYPEIVGIGTDGTTIYWSFLARIRKSADGSSWSVDQTFLAPNKLLYGRILYNTIRSKLLIGINDTTSGQPNTAVLRRDSSWVEDTEITPQGIFLIHPSLRRVDSTPVQEYILYNTSPPAGGDKVYHRPPSGGNYTLDADSPAIDSVLSLAGKRYGSILGLIFILGGTSLKIFSRNGDSGVWTNEHSFINYDLPGTRISAGLFEAQVNISPDQL